MLYKQGGLPASLASGNWILEKERPGQGVSGPPGSHQVRRRGFGKPKDICTTPLEACMLPAGWAKEGSRAREQPHGGSPARRCPAPKPEWEQRAQAGTVRWRAGFHCNCSQAQFTWALSSQILRLKGDIKTEEGWTGVHAQPSLLSPPDETGTG